MAVHSGKDNQPYGEPDENRQSQGAQRPYNGDASFGQQDGWKDVMDTVTDLAGNLAEELGIASGESVRNSAQNLGKQLNKVIDGSTQWLKNTLESNQNASDTPLLAPPRCAPLDEKLVAKNRREGRFRRFMRAEGAGIAVACAIFFRELWWVVPALYLGLYIWMHWGMAPSEDERNRIQNYQKLAQKKGCSVWQIAEKLGMPAEQVVQDLICFTQRGLLGDCYYHANNGMLYKDHDSFEKCLKRGEVVVFPELPPEPVLEPLPQTADQPEQQWQEAQWEEPENTAQAEYEDEQLRRYQEKSKRAEEFLEQLQEYRGMAQQDPEFCNQIERMYVLLQPVLEWVKIHPESWEKLDRFDSYYIPTVQKFIHTYCQIRRQNGEIAEKTRRDILDALGKINLALEAVPNQLLSDMALDVSTESSVLETLLHQDGYSGNDTLKL
ncbi:MAG: hypothetical protein H9882_03100 [Candidatus Fournierella pullistercoris]|uniref:Uncharacterized protein n=1 Tax=Candidatus Allofournierella pullistercoris TaxID=2838597 RepID=A0A948T1W2_9FIRM|nr:hypothetical protein [Candidatus Fournierella pullistercoris]